MQKLIDQVKNILSNRFIKNINITLFENIVSKGFNFLIILFLTRILEPENYGKYSFVAIAVIACSTIFDFGMDNTIIRFSSKEKKYDKSIFGLYFIAKTILAMLFVCIILLFGSYILTSINKEEIIRFIPIMLIGSVGEYFLLVNDAYFQAIQRFGLRAFVNISRYLIAFLFVVILYFTHNLILENVLLIYLIPLIVCLIFCFNYYSFIKSFFYMKIPINIIKEIFEYEKWMLWVSVANTLLIRIDIIMISIWVSFSKIGIYNAAFQLCNIVALLPLAMERVMLPKLSELDKADILQFSKKSIKFISIGAIIILCIIPFLGFLPVLFYGKEYEEAGLILQILLVSTTISFIVLPMDQAFFALGKPKYNTISKYSQLILIIIICSLTIPTFGYVWASISVLIGRIIYALICGVFFIREYQKLKNQT
ncbi:MAG: oligosaccharide flippase family protein [Cyanobacteriota bacterium]